MLLEVVFNSEPWLTQDKDEGALLSLFVYENLIIHSQIEPYSQVWRLDSFFFFLRLRNQSIGSEIISLSC